MRIDVAVALAMASLGAVRGGQTRNFFMEYIDAELERMEREKGFSNGLCSNPKCRKPILPDASYIESRGLKFCFARVLLVMERAGGSCYQGLVGFHRLDPYVLCANKKPLVASPPGAP